MTHPATQILTSTPPAPADADPVVRRITLRLIPFLCLLFVVNYLDRTNIAMAKLRMLTDTHLDERMFGLGAGLFFIGYFIFEVPSNLILERVGARRWIARIMITWGLISAAFMFVRGPWSFYTLRFALGVAEAGFFPGIVLYLTYWIPQRRRSKVLAAFLTSTAFSGAIGSPLAGAIMLMNGIGGLRGWQWLFLLEGIVPVILGIFTLALLPDKPRNARWLSDCEREILEAELARDQPHEHHTVALFRHALADHRLWLLSAIYFMLIMGLYSFVYWVPSIIKSVTPVSDLEIGMLSAIPSAVAAISMVLIGAHSDRHAERRWHIAVCAILSASAVAAIPLCHSTRPLLAVLSAAAVGIFGVLGPFWSLSTKFLRGSAAAGGIAIVNSIGALAGYVAPYAIGWAKQSTGHFTWGLLLVSASLFCGCVLVLCIPRAVDRGPASALT